MDLQHLHRLKEEQDRALAETDSQLEQWNKFRTDYIALQDRLKTLPNKTTHEVMVPFGSLAFMPGQLVHTNEILVLLGDNYFVERSAFQAVEIVSRRLKELDKNIKSLQKQRELLSPRADFTSQMIQMTQGVGEQREIVEPLDEEQERLWRERHKEYLRQEGQRRQKERASKVKEEETKTVEKTDEDLWERLDQLEQQEKQGQELELSSEDSQDVSQSPQPGEQLTEQGPRGWDEEDRLDEDEDVSSSLDDSDIEDETEEEEEENEEEEDLHPRQRVITFSHTKAQDDLSERNPGVKSDDNTVLINSPADLYTLVKTTPKSILKTGSNHKTTTTHKVQCAPQEDRQQKMVNFVDDSSGATSAEKKSRGGGQRSPRHVQDGWRESAMGGHPAVSEEEHAERNEKSPVQAFADTVVERPAQPSFTFHPQSSAPSISAPSVSAAAAAEHEAGASSRPISKFRASRQKSNSATSTLSPSGAALQGQDGGSATSTRPVSKFRASRQKQDGVR